jgi:hypothetical protein
MRRHPTGLALLLILRVLATPLAAEAQRLLRR